MSACKALDWQTIPSTIIDFENVLHGELAENVIRKDFLPSEAVAIADAVRESVATPVGRPPREKVETFHNIEPGKTRDKLASYVGVSGRTLDKATEVVLEKEHAAAKGLEAI